jgi:hypothetical protein
MKIATFNINNVNKRLGNLLAWLRDQNAILGCKRVLVVDTGSIFRRCTTRQNPNRMAPMNTHFQGARPELPDAPGALGFGLTGGGAADGILTEGADARSVAPVVLLTEVVAGTV